MAFLSSFYPQPVVAGTSEGTYAEGDDSRITGAIQSGGAAGGGLSGTYPNPTLAPVISSGSITARSVADRFTDQFVNVLDFGADPTGATDSWLAIQRAILAASNDAEFYPNAATMTEADTTAPFTNWPQVPILRSRKGRKWVYLPRGTYRITQSIGTYELTKICGDGIATKILKAGAGDFPAFEDLHHWVARMYPDWPNWSQSNPWWLSTPFSHGAMFRDFSIESEQPWNGSSAATTSWFRFPIWGDASENGNPCQAIAGSNTVTPTMTELALFAGDKIKFRGLPTEYTIASYNGTTITTVESIVTAPNGAHLQKRMPICHGIVTAGGEQIRIENILINSQNGYGIYTYFGSPAIITIGGMINGCRVAYKIEAGNGTLIRPSGDDNGIFLEAGIEQVTSVEVYSCKIEGGKVSGGTASAPCVFRLGCISQIANHLKIHGGTCNPVHLENFWYSDSAITNDTSFIEVVTKNFQWPIIDCNGPATIGWGKNFYKEKNYYTGAVVRRVPRTDGFIQYENGFKLHGTSGAYFDAQNDSKFVENTTNIVLGARFGSNSGIILDPVANSSLSGAFGNVTFTREDGSTTAEITTSTAHDLEVGDYISFRNYSSTTPSNTSLSGTNDNGETMYFTGVFRVVAKPSSTKIQITVNNSGATAGSALMFVYRYITFHDIKSGTHRFQMPSNLGNTTDRSAVLFLDKERRKMAGLRVATANEGDWWANKSLNMGGTIDNPASRILHGTGVPSASAPNGSLYLRTDGDASTTLYVRAGGAWSALT